MRRWVLFVSLVMLVVQVRPAAACSMVFPTIEMQTEFAEIVVIGTVSKSEESVATVDVEQSLKGTADQTITVLNRTLSINTDCTAVLSADDRGFRFGEGTRWLMFLKKADFDLGATWQESLPTGIGMIPITDDAIQYPNQNGGKDTLSLEDIRATVNATLATLPTPTPLDQNQIQPTAPPAPVQATVAPIEPAVLPTPTPLGAKLNPDAETTTASWTSTTLPWILLVIGVLSGLGALWGWRRERKQRF